MAMKLPHWLRIVLITSEGLWLITTRDKPYFTLAGDPNVKPGSLQFGSDAAAYFDSDTVLVLPFPKELSMELKY